MSKLFRRITLAATIAISPLSLGQDYGGVKLVKSNPQNEECHKGILRFMGKGVQFLSQNDKNDPPDLAIQNTDIKSLQYQTVSKRRLELRDLRDHPERIPAWWLIFIKYDEHVLTIQFHDGQEHDQSVKLLLGKQYRDVLRAAEKCGMKIQGGSNGL